MRLIVQRVNLNTETAKVNEFATLETTTNRLDVGREKECRFYAHAAWLGHHYVLVQNVSTDRAQVATIALGVNAGVNAKIHFEAGMR